MRRSSSARVSHVFEPEEPVGMALRARLRHSIVAVRLNPEVCRAVDVEIGDGHEAKIKSAPAEREAPPKRGSEQLIDKGASTLTRGAYQCLAEQSPSSDPLLSCLRCATDNILTRLP